LNVESSRFFQPSAFPKSPRHLACLKQVKMRLEKPKKVKYHENGSLGKEPSAGSSYRCRSTTLRKKLSLSVKILFIVLILSTNAFAMDRWTALAMLESGGDDHTVGPAGEISRYQIRPQLWPGGDPLDAHVALANARQIMSPRLATFEQSHHRAPDDFEFYILWNAPVQINHPHAAVAERARRFANLVHSPDPPETDPKKP
jgi:hypothetical protein